MGILVYIEEVFDWKYSFSLESEHVTPSNNRAVFNVPFVSY